MRELRINERFEVSCPALSEDELQKLETLIIKDGIIYNPILIWNNVIIDGHNRYYIAKRHKIEFTTKEISFESDDDAIAWIKENAISQRNLNDYQRSKLVLELEDYYRAKAKENLKKTGGDKKSGSPILAKPIIESIDVRETLAKKAGVSHGTIDKVKFIDNNAVQGIKEKLERGEISINKAFNEIKEPQNEISPEINILESAAGSLERWINKNSDKESMFEFIPAASVLAKKIRDKKAIYE
jgi:hypothetical protein